MRSGWPHYPGGGRRWRTTCAARGWLESLTARARRDVSAISSRAAGTASAPVAGATARSEARSLAPWVVLAVALAAAAGLIMYLGRGLTFNYDEWEYVLFRQGHDLD